MVIRSPVSTASPAEMTKSTPLWLCCAGFDPAFGFFVHSKERRFEFLGLQHVGPGARTG
ncbi:MAG: hypothetical protein AAFW64_04775 [Pseudomonadota bacterium]